MKVRVKGQVGIIRNNLIKFYLNVVVKKLFYYIVIKYSYI